MNGTLTVDNNVFDGIFTEQGCTFTIAGNAAPPAGFMPNTMGILNVPANPEFQNTEVRILGTNGNVIRLQIV